MDLMKLGMDEVLKVPYTCRFSARGGAKVGHGGSPSSKNFRLEGYSNNQMHTL